MFNQLDKLDLTALGLLVRFLRMVSVYFLFSGTAFILLYLVFRKWLRPWYIQPKRWPKAWQLRQEIFYSLLTRLIFMGIAIGISWAYMNGYTRLFKDPEVMGWPYVLATTLGLILVHDTYFYWAHRWMHGKKVFQHVHAVHHRFTNPTPLAAYAFHPLEAVVEAAFFPVIVFLVPLCTWSVVFLLVFQNLFNILGHSGFELLPVGFRRTWLFKILNTSTHHNQHHQRFNCNYGLYFNIWDRIMGTNHPEYEAHFERSARGHFSDSAEQSAVEDSLHLPVGDKQ